MPKESPLSVIGMSCISDIRWTAGFGLSGPATLLIGIAIDTVAEAAGLQTIPLQAEHYDFAIPKKRRERPAVAAFVRLLQSDAGRAGLRRLGFECDAAQP